MNLSTDQPAAAYLNVPTQDLSAKVRGSKKARILVVEDERVVARDIANSLSELGYTVVATVATGDGAIKNACEFRPDLVLMDIRLRGDLDGVQAAESIWRNNAIPVIFLTANSDEETLARAARRAAWLFSEALQNP